MFPFHSSGILWLNSDKHIILLSFGEMNMKTIFLSTWDKSILASKTTLLKNKESIVLFLVLCTDPL